MAILWPFLVIFSPLHWYLSQNLCADDHFEVLNASKATRQNTNFPISSFFQLWKKNFWKFLTHKRPLFDYFWSYYANYRKVFHKSEVQTIILRCLVCLNLNWIKNYNIMLVKIFFFSCLKMHHFSTSLPKWILTPSKENSSHVFKITIFSKLFGAFTRHIIR